MYDTVERAAEVFDAKKPQHDAAVPAEQQVIQSASAMIVGRADDPYEAAADRTAAEVQRRLSAGPLRRSSHGGGADPLGGQAISSDTESKIRSSSGRPMEAPVRGQLEQAFGGVDFGSVRIHDGGSVVTLSRSL